jgi:hypothetical protein
MRDHLSKTIALVILAAATMPITSFTRAIAADATTFSITIRNVSTPNTLALSDGKTTAAPIAPGLYAVVKEGVKLFTPDQMADRSLESLAEDGDAAALLTAIKGIDG